MLRLVLVSLLAVGCVPKSELDAANEKIKTLEAENAELKKSAPAGKATPAPDSPEEQAAKALMSDVQTAMKANDYATAKAKLAELQEKYPNTRAGKGGARIASEVNFIGADAPALDVEKWFQGKGDYSKSKATLLVFWEVWCPHCKKEIPELAKKEADFKAKGLQVVGITKVTKTATDDKVTDFLKENDVKFPVGKEKDGSLSSAFKVAGIPAAAIVKDGKIVWRGHPARLDDATIAQVLGG